MMGLSDELKCLKQLKPWGDEEEEREPSQKDKPLHDMYHQQIEEVANIKKSYHWLGLSKVGLRHGTDALIMATQEQALSPRAIKARTTSTSSNPTPDKTPGAGYAKRPLRQPST